MPSPTVRPAAATTPTACSTATARPNGPLTRSSPRLLPSSSACGGPLRAPSAAPSCDRAHPAPGAEPAGVHRHPSRAAQEAPASLCPPAGCLFSRSFRPRPARFCPGSVFPGLSVTRPPLRRLIPVLLPAPRPVPRRYGGYSHRLFRRPAPSPAGHSPLPVSAYRLLLSRSHAAAAARHVASSQSTRPLAGASFVLNVWHAASQQAWRFLPGVLPARACLRSGRPSGRRRRCLQARRMRPCLPPAPYSACYRRPRARHPCPVPTPIGRYAAVTPTLTLPDPYERAAITWPAATLTARHRAPDGPCLHPGHGCHGRVPRPGASGLRLIACRSRPGLSTADLAPHVQPAPRAAPAGHGHHLPPVLNPSYSRRGPVDLRAMSAAPGRGTVCFGTYCHAPVRLSAAPAWSTPPAGIARSPTPTGAGSPRDHAAYSGDARHQVPSHISGAHPQVTYLDSAAIG